MTERLKQRLRHGLWRRLPASTTLVLAAVLCACGSAPSDARAAERNLAEQLAESGQHAQFTVYLVRHAEKKDGDDPGLTAEGRRRAKRLARLLADAQLSHVYSTDYRRTRRTAAPVAAKAGRRTQLYDPRSLADFAQHLQASGGRALVVGHSNTTPALVTELGGDPGGPIDDATEFDRLYVVVEMPNGSVTTTLYRY